jgi:hypothetical protein
MYVCKKPFVPPAPASLPGPLQSPSLLPLCLTPPDRPRHWFPFCRPPQTCPCPTRHMPCPTPFMLPTLFPLTFSQVHSLPQKSVSCRHKIQSHIPSSHFFFLLPQPSFPPPSHFHDFLMHEGNLGEHLWRQPFYIIIPLFANVHLLK